MVLVLGGNGSAPASFYELSFTSSYARREQSQSEGGYCEPNLGNGELVSLWQRTKRTNSATRFGKNRREDGEEGI